MKLPQIGRAADAERARNSFRAKKKRIETHTWTKYTNITTSEGAYARRDNNDETRCDDVVV